MNENSSDNQQNNESTKRSSFISQTESNMQINHTFRTIRKRMPWSEEEDKSIKSLVNKYGTRNWTLISNKMGQNRSGKQCRERWYNQLNPDMNKKDWTDKEEIILFSKQMQLGNKWADIASFLPGRTLTDIKNHFYSKLRKFIRKILNQINEENLFALNGIDGCKYTGEKIYKMIKKHEINYKNLTKKTIFEMIIANENDPKGNYIFSSDNSNNYEYNSYNSNYINNSGYLANNIFNDINEEVKNNKEDFNNKNIIYTEFLNNNSNNFQPINKKLKIKLAKKKNDNKIKKNKTISENKSRMKYKIRKKKNSLNNNILKDNLEKDNNNQKLIINKNLINEKEILNNKKNEIISKNDINIIKSGLLNKENGNKLIGVKRKKCNNIITSNNHSQNNSKSNCFFQLNPSFQKNNNKELFLSEVPTIEKKEKIKSKKKKLKSPSPEEKKENELIENSQKITNKKKLKSKTKNKENNCNICFYPLFKVATPKTLKNIQFPPSETKSNKSIKPEDFSFTNKINLNDYLELSQMQQLFPNNFENLLFQQKNKNFPISSDLSVDNYLLKSRGSIYGSVKNDNTSKNLSIDENFFNKLFLQSNMNNNICIDENNLLEEKTEMNLNKKNEKPTINLELINHQDFTNTFINGKASGGNESQYNSIFNKNNQINIYNSSPSSLKSIGNNILN